MRGAGLNRRHGVLDRQWAAPLRCGWRKAGQCAAPQKQRQSGKANWQPALFGGGRASRADPPFAAKADQPISATGGGLLDENAVAQDSGHGWDVDGYGMGWDGMGQWMD